ncbi:helix-turn-helix domain-containing protein [Streptomyces acidiscabies]|uniref:helix-turn-helix domain-containing protein n=1 Tax=Streptomyces acidiscabies TaxID=42234 RepID=UPI000D1BE003|nr:helix-turn-helix domain-containing protein [Streptomyces acidiscabies]
MASRRTQLAQRRKACGFSQEGFATAMEVDRTTAQRWESGTVDPHPYQRPKMAGLLQIDLEELDILLRPEDPPLPVMNGDRGEGLAFTIRQTTERLVALDNEVHGLPIADMAARAFKRVHRRLGSGDYDQKSEHDIQAAAAELAEVTGWALFNEGKFRPSRRFGQEALFLAKLAGDRSVELITLQNMGMLAGWSGRAREELAIARSVLDKGKLSPRVEAMFRAREGQGLAGSGRFSEASRSFDHARSLLLDSAPSDEPSWVWWVSSREIDRQQGRVYHEAGDWNAAIPILERAMEHQEGSYVGYQNVAAVRLLDSLLRVRSWRSAEIEAEKLMPAVSEMSSVVTLNILERVADQGKRLTDAPSSLRDALDCIQATAEEDPYDI